MSLSNTIPKKRALNYYYNHLEMTARLGYQSEEICENKHENSRHYRYKNELTKLSIKY